MNELQKHLDKAFVFLSKYPEDWGQLIDHMAMARQELREAFRLANEQKEETENG